LDLNIFCCECQGTLFPFVRAPLCMAKKYLYLTGRNSFIILCHEKMLGRLMACMA
jgi:hypothetical protein